MRSPQTIALAGVITLGLALTACSEGSNTTVGTGKTVEGQPFTMAVSADPGNLDPHFTSLSVTLQVDAFMYDSLVNLDPAGEDGVRPGREVGRRRHQGDVHAAQGRDVFGRFAADGGHCGGQHQLRR